MAYAERQERKKGGPLPRPLQDRGRPLPVGRHLQHWRASAHCTTRTGDRKTALADLRKAIAICPVG